MRLLVRLFSFAAVASAFFATAAKADLVNHGGPVLKSFEVVPYYYGAWALADMVAHQAYLSGLTQYLSGADAPANAQTTLVQYGVTSATLAPYRVDAAPTAPVQLDKAGVLSVIETAQSQGHLPPFAPNRLILLLLPKGSTVQPHCAYHSSDGVGRYYSVVSQDCLPWLEVTGHEIFEASTDPAIDDQAAWDEAVDPCSTNVSLSFGVIPGAFDNTTHSCSTSGYDATTPESVPGSVTGIWQAGRQPEIQANGWTYQRYRQKYDELWDMGWRLKVLQPYVSGEQVLYNAIWAPGTDDETQLYGATYPQLRAKYDLLWPQGWRLKSLTPYALGGDVYYSAVWQRSSEGEIQIYGATYEQYRSNYDRLWTQGWRLKLLQPYVVGSAVYFTAVWRPSTDNETQLYNATYAQYRAKYDQLWTQGWRLKLLEPYVVGGVVYYTAVWRPGTYGEIQIYGASDAAYRAEDDGLRAQGWHAETLRSY